MDQVQRWIKITVAYFRQVYVFSILFFCKKISDRNFDLSSYLVHSNGQLSYITPFQCVMYNTDSKKTVTLLTTSKVLGFVNHITSFGWVRKTSFLCTFCPFIIIPQFVTSPVRGLISFSDKTSTKMYFRLLFTTA